MKDISEVFDNLDNWRQFPTYQLERRADIFFSIYLKEILETKLGIPIKGIVPEFPLANKALNGGQGNNTSVKVDYLAVGKDGTTILLVELKTDNQSTREDQFAYLLKAKQAQPKEILNGLKPISDATQKKAKYQRLIQELNDLGLIRNTGNGSFEAIVEDSCMFQIVLIQPKLSQLDSLSQAGIDRHIDFADIVEIVEQHNDPLSQRFAKSLKCWQDEQPGKDCKETKPL